MFNFYDKKRVYIILLILTLFSMIFYSYQSDLFSEEEISYSEVDKKTYSTALFAYSDAIHDSYHNNGYSEDEIFSWYNTVVLTEESYYYVQNDGNKDKVFLYLDIYGKDSNQNQPWHVIPSPPFFITENFPQGHGSVQVSGGPYCYIQEDGYFQDLLSVLGSFFSDLSSNGLEIKGIFLDDYANVADYWDDDMTQGDMDHCWPGRGSTDLQKEDWWLNEQYPRMKQFEEDLHNLFYSYFGRSELMTNGGVRLWRDLPSGSKEPYYYNNSAYPEDLNKITRRCFEGPTLDMGNHLNFDTLFAEEGTGAYKYWRKFFPKDLMLIYAIDGDPGDGENGEYGDWVYRIIGDNDYIRDGYNDWIAATDGAYIEGSNALVALAYGAKPFTGGTSLSLISNPNENPWPYQEKRMNIILEPG